MYGQQRGHFRGHQYVEDSVGGYLNDNPDFGGGYGQGEDEDLYSEIPAHRPRRGGNKRGPMMGNQGGVISKMIGSQGGMMGSQSAMMGGQSAMIGGQMGMMGGQMGMMPGQSQVSSGANQELLAIVKQQNEVISKLSERIGGMDSGHDYQGGGGPGGGEMYDEFEAPMMAPMGHARRPMRGGGPMRGRPMRGRPMHGGPMGPPMRGGPMGRGFGMPQRGVMSARARMSPEKRRGDFQGDFGAKRMRLDNEGRPIRSKSGYALKSPEQKEKEREKQDSQRKTSAYLDTSKTDPKRSSTQYRKLLRKRVQNARSEDGSFPKFVENTVIGRKYIQPVNGFYCELCRKFFKAREEATIEHCMTWAHYQRLKNLKFPKEEKDELKKDNEDEKDDKSKVKDIEDEDEDGDAAMEDEEELLKED